jgi:UTP-glucose-1-phosphate uridylyltransferase
MAAGRGSRYGGAKQVAGVGPAGERLLEYAVFDARQAGFRRIVFITRSDLLNEFTALVRRLPPELEYEVVTQPASAKSRHGALLNRAKPWGTVHAVLAARSALPMPFAIVNADDFYGRMTYSLAAAACHEAEKSGRFALVGMRLDRTLSPSGPVARGVCVTRDDELVWLDEVREVARSSEGIHGTFPDGVRALTGAEIASMNCWVFTPAIFAGLQAAFDEFLDRLGHDEKAEATLPEAVNALVQAGTARVRVLEAPGPWFGITHPEDRDRVVDGLRELTVRGVYPTPLWGA